MSAQILVVDDEQNIRLMLEPMLQLAGYDVRSVGSAEEALALSEEADFDLVLLDVRLPGMDGLQALSALRGTQPAPDVLMMSGHGTIETAVQAVRSGAINFLEKPLSRDATLMAVESALRMRSLRAENERLRAAAKGEPLLGESRAMVALRQRIQQVGQSDARVLIRGESGTGKELVAQAIHAASARCDKPFIALNCAAIPAELIESELFGHTKGAFTGATSARAGVFEAANGGILFLDEVGDMPLPAQAKLLRVLENQTVTRLGSHREIKVDVRVLSATHRDLKRMSSEQSFREDLYHRLHVVPVDVPALRDRLEDVSLLAEHFLAREIAIQKLPRRRFASAALKALGRYSWPGNVRELRNFVERLAILAVDETVDEAFVISELPSAEGEAVPTLKESVALAERRAIVSALRGAAGNVAEAARRLGLERSHLYKKAKALGLQVGERDG